MNAPVHPIDAERIPAVRQDTTFVDRVLYAVLGLCIGVLACAGLAFTHGPPRCAASSSIVELRP